MGAFTAYGRSLLLNGLFVAPATVGNTLIALTSVIPGTADDVSRLVEPVVGSYARNAYPFASGWEAGQAGELFNRVAVTFITPTADWGAIRGWALLTGDAAHVVATGELRQVVVVKSAMSVVIPVHGIRAVLK